MIQIRVFYEGFECSYTMTVLGGACNYTVSYVDETGNKIAETISGVGTAEEQLSLEIPEIEGYTPLQKEQVETIGYENNFIVRYLTNEKQSIEHATVKVDKQYFNNKKLTPEITVKIDGVL